MTRLPLLIGVLAMLGAGAAMAQGAPGAAMPPPPPPGAPGSGPPHPPHPPMQLPGGWMGMHGQPMLMQRAAMFRFRRGDAEIDIKCAADESTQACVEAAGTLIDKLHLGPPH